MYWKRKVLVRMDVAMGGLRHERSLMKPGKDEFQLTRIGIDVADGENAFGAGLEFLGVDRDQVLVEIEPEIRDRPELHGEPEEGKQRVGGNLSGRAIHALDRDRLKLAAGALQPDRLTKLETHHALRLELTHLAHRCRGGTELRRGDAGA